MFCRKVLIRDFRPILRIDYDFKIQIDRFRISIMSNRYEKYIDWISASQLWPFLILFCSIQQQDRPNKPNPSLLKNYKRVSLDDMHAKTYNQSVSYRLCIHTPKEVIPWSLIHRDSASCEACRLILYGSYVSRRSNKILEIF